jgi:hypothetical protein
MRVTADEHLDVRTPACLDEEILGRVRYDWNPQTRVGTRLVDVNPTATRVLDLLHKHLPSREP